MPYRYNVFTGKLDYYATVSGGGGGVTDHGALTGLSDDDHSQYLLTSGARELTGTWNYGSQTISGTGTIAAATPTSDNHLTNKSYVDSTAAAYGVEWDEDDSSPTLTRLGSLVGVATGSSPGNAVLPVHAGIRRCVVNDSGVVQYYLCDTDSTFKEDGVTAASISGADGQVMVEIPKFYYKYSYVDATNKHQWWVSSTELSGYSVHPAFTKNGAEVDNRYIGAYEGVLYDTSASQYTNGLYLPSASGTFTASTDTIERTVESHPFTLLDVGDKVKVTGTTSNNTTFTVVTTGDQSITVTSGTVTDEAGDCIIEIEKDWTATTGDVLSSVSGKSPINQGIRANFRAAAKNRGTGWRQQDYDLVSAIQLLYVVEYASWYSQSVIGAGLTDWSSGVWVGWNDYNPIETTGNSNSVGNATSNVSNGDGSVGSYMSYRGMENFFGHLRKWVDGFNVNDGIPYVSNTDTDFADDTATNYTQLTDTVGSGIVLPQGTNDYQVTLEQIDRGFLPASVVGGSSSTYITDYYYQNSGWRVAMLGGDADFGGVAGFFSWRLSFSSSNLNRYFGGRLSY